MLGIASRASAGWLTAHKVTPVEYGNGLVERLRDAAPDGIDAFIDLFGPSTYASPSISACHQSVSTPSCSPTPGRRLPAE